MICHEYMRIALLAYTYGKNGIVVPPPATVAYIDTIRAAADIRRAEWLGADRTIIFIHWGIEYDTIPSSEQKKTAAALQRAVRYIPRPRCCVSKVHCVRFWPPSEPH